MAGDVIGVVIQSGRDHRSGSVVGSGVPIHFSRSGVGHDPLTPGVGEHNDAVYGELLGYTTAHVAALRADGVI